MSACMSLHTYVCMHGPMYVCMYACMHGCMGACMCVCVCMYVCTYVRTYERRHVRMYVCMYVCMYERMYVYVRACIRKHVYMRQCKPTQVPYSESQKTQHTATIQHCRQLDVQPWRLNLPYYCRITYYIIQCTTTWRTLYHIILYEDMVPYSIM